MFLLNYARKLMIKVYAAGANISIMQLGNERQKSVLERYKQPADLCERSLFQYKCQMHSLMFVLKMMQDIIAMFLLPYYLIRPFKKAKASTVKGGTRTAVFFTNGNTRDILPESLKNEFETIIECSYKGGLFIGKTDREFIKYLVLKYWFLPFYCLKCVVKIGLYAKQIQIHHPDAIIVCSEYSFTSSMLTAYCRSLGIEHINVMHGEKLYNIRDAFVEFDRYYVWDQHYVNLLISLKAEPTQFIVEVPLLFGRLNNKFTQIYDFTYYLGNENKRDLLKISLILNELKKQGLQVCVRFHPRYSEISRIHKIFTNISAEDPHKVSLEESLNQTDCAISSYSTVLYQAYISGKNIIIDDLTNRAKYESLKGLDYIMLNKPHELLSGIVNN